MGSAAFHNALELIWCLQAAGASLETGDRFGEPPLFSAVEWAADDAFGLLLRLGADTARVDRRARTLLLHGPLRHRRHDARHCRRRRPQRMPPRADQAGLTAAQLLDRRQPEA